MQDRVGESRGAGSLTDLFEVPEPRVHHLFHAEEFGAEEVASGRYLAAELGAETSDLTVDIGAQIAEPAVVDQDSHQDNQESGDRARRNRQHLRLAHDPIVAKSRVPRHAAPGRITFMKTIAAFLLPAALALFAQPQRPVETFDTTAGKVTITPIHHASMMIEAAGKVIHVDPWSEGNYTGLPKADLILITHIHQDHLDPKEIALLKKGDTTIIAPAAVAKTVTEAKVIANGEKTAWDSWSIEAVPMYNLTRGPAPGKFYHDKGRGNGYVLTYGGKRFYIAGDTEGIPEMRALRNIDVAFVPMNLPFTMTPEEAVEAVKAFHPKIVYPYHYRGSNIQAFAAALAGSGIEVRLQNWYY